MISNELATKIQQAMKDALAEKARKLENPVIESEIPELVYPLYKDLRHQKLEFSLNGKSYFAVPYYRENNFFIVAVNMSVYAINYEMGAQGVIWELTPELIMKASDEMGTQAFIKMNTRKN